jgi:hypothetical protein
MAVVAHSQSADAPAGHSSAVSHWQFIYEQVITGPRQSIYVLVVNLELIEYHWEFNGD